MNEDQVLEEFSRMNNELVNARRELTRVNAALEERKRFLAKVLELSPYIVCVYDLDRGAAMYASSSIMSMLGYGADERKDLGDECLASLVHPEDQERFAMQPAMLRDLGDGLKAVFEYRARDRSGVWHWLQSTDTVFERRTDGAVRLVLGTIQDVSAEKAREALLKEASLIDELTGQRNRRSFGELAEQHLRGSVRRGEPFAIFFLDLDDFKHINDWYGHAEGDEALRAAAGILDTCFRSGDILARHGGDEFIALLSQANGEVTASLIRRVRQATALWNGQAGRPWRLAFSIGTAMFDPAAPLGLPDLIARADQSMYEDKRAGTGGALCD